LTTLFKQFETLRQKSLLNQDMIQKISHDFKLLKKFRSKLVLNSKIFEEVLPLIAQSRVMQFDSENSSNNQESEMRWSILAQISKGLNDFNTNLKVPTIGFAKSLFLKSLQSTSFFSKKQLKQIQSFYDQSLLILARFCD